MFHGRRRGAKPLPCTPVDLYGLLGVLVRELADRLGGHAPRGAAGRVAGAEDRATAMADIVALAALADGQVTREELERLQETTFGEQQVPAAERLYQLGVAADEAQSPEWLTVRVSDLALRLHDDERREVMRQVLRLAGCGARLRRREPSRESLASLDEAPRRRAKEPEQERADLVALFARALGIEEGELVALGASLEPC